jgi:protein gp37
MGKTTIEWTDASWNPIVGCTEISPGCANCYAARLAATRLKNTPQYKGLSTIDNPPANIGPRWSGEVRFLPERLDEPRHWPKPRKIFVCDMGDLFHEDVSEDFIDRVYAIMLACHRHTFQVLTKRPVRMRDYFCNLTAKRVCKHLRPGEGTLAWPIRNLWLGTSVENQHFADERIPALLSTPAAVRWISAEPLLGSVDVAKHLYMHRIDPKRYGTEDEMRGQIPFLDWVVCGGESGLNARPMHPHWAQSLRDQCQAAGVPFFFKQWGEYSPYGHGFVKSDEIVKGPHTAMFRLGKKKAGRLLDGREWNEFPKELTGGVHGKDADRSR